VPERIRELVASKLSRATPADLQDWNDTYVFSVEGGEIVALEIHDGVVTNSDSVAGVKPDCVFRFTEEELTRFLDGKSNLQSAWMRGDIEIEGDFPAAYRLYSFLRGTRKMG
jgi:putative sterol carrier protein